MVGRAEVLDASTERDVLRFVQLFEVGRTDEALVGLRGLGLGRRLEAALTRPSVVKTTAAAPMLQFSCSAVRSETEIQEAKDAIFRTMETIKIRLRATEPQLEVTAVQSAGRPLAA